MRRREGGFTVIEVTVAMAITAVALLGLVSAMAFTAKRSALTAEVAIAQDALRQKVEEMHGRPVDRLVATYDDTDADDPFPGAPGPFFDVPGLTPQGGDPACGRISFPAYADAFPYAGHEPSLDEAQMAPLMGMPRDLDGDGAASAVVRAKDVTLCPARVRIAWRGVMGDQAIEAYMMFGER